MRCDACVKDVSDTLYKLQGITKVDANLKDQLVLVEGTGTQGLTPQQIIENNLRHGVAPYRRLRSVTLFVG